jgi:hypothetical protein
MHWLEQMWTCRYTEEVCTFALKKVTKTYSQNQTLNPGRKGRKAKGLRSGEVYHGSIN